MGEYADRPRHLVVNYSKFCAKRPEARLADVVTVLCLHRLQAQHQSVYSWLASHFGSRFSSCFSFLSSQRQRCRNQRTRSGALAVKRKKPSAIKITPKGSGLGATTTPIRISKMANNAVKNLNSRGEKAACFPFCHTQTPQLAPIALAGASRPG